MSFRYYKEKVLENCLYICMNPCYCSCLLSITMSFCRENENIKLTSNKKQKSVRKKETILMITTSLHTIMQADSFFFFVQFRNREKRGGLNVM